MGQIIQNRQILKQEIILQSAEISSLDTTPVIVFPETLTNPTNNYTIIAAQLSVTDAATTVSSFGHFYLQYDPTSKLAVYDINNGVVQGNFRNNFIINMSHPPNHFGSITLQNLGIDLRISSELAPGVSGGNGEMKVTIYYFDNF
jgi:hypothetical protein